VGHFLTRDIGYDMDSASRGIATSAGRPCWLPQSEPAVDSATVPPRWSNRYRSKLCRLPASLFCSAHLVARTLSSGSEYKRLGKAILTALALLDPRHHTVGVDVADLRHLLVRGRLVGNAERCLVLSAGQGADDVAHDRHAPAEGADDSEGTPDEKE
jgi:hypothetical protein